MKLNASFIITLCVILINNFFSRYLFACNTPVGITATDITASTAVISWNLVPLAIAYNVHHRINGASTWNTINVTSNSVTLYSLLPGTMYEVQVQSICSTDTGQFSNIETFATRPPMPDHIVICIMENKNFEDIIDTSAAPYINSVAGDTSTALFMNSHAIEHPSFPNYLDLYSGSNQGVTQDTCLSDLFTAENLGSQLISAGKTFATYCEDLPYEGYSGCAMGNYVKKHNASVNWQGTDVNQIPPECNQQFDAFAGLSDYNLLPTVSFVIPNKINDMHGGTIEDGDIWLQNNLGDYIEWAKTNNSLFIFTFDEDDNSPSNHIPTLFTGEMVKEGDYTFVINHFDVLRAIEEMYGLPYAGNADTATTILGCWKSADSIATSDNFQSQAMPEIKFEIFPTIVSDEAKISFSLPKPTTVIIDIYSVNGKREALLKSNVNYDSGIHSFTFSVRDLRLIHGNYLVRLITSEDIAARKLIVN
jgi:hypothetical protein